MRKGGIKVVGQRSTAAGQGKSKLTEGERCRLSRGKKLKRGEKEIAP